VNDNPNSSSPAAFCPSLPQLIHCRNELSHHDKQKKPSSMAITSPLNLSTNSNKSDSGSFSPLVTTCYTINYIVGTGILTLPWAYYQSGTLLSTLLTALVCFLATISSDYFLTSLVRAESITSFLDRSKRNPDGDFDDDMSDSVFMLLLTSSTTSEITMDGDNDEDDDDEKDRRNDGDPGYALAHSHRNVNGNGYGTVPVPPPRNITAKRLPLLRHRKKFEIMQLCDLFLGPIGSLVFTVPTVLYMYGFLWSYACVFAGAMERSVPLAGDGDDYAVYVLMFAVIVVPISFLALPEQIYIQLGLSACRFLLIFLVVVTPLLGFPSGNVSADDDNFFDQDDAYVGGEGAEGAMLMNFTGFGKTFPAVVSSVAFHLAVPDLAMEIQDKRLVGSVFASALGIVGLAYAAIGITCAWYFGENVNQSINLNWKGYGSEGGMISSFVEFFVICFPAFDVVSAFTLNCFILANILKGIFCKDPNATPNVNTSANNNRRSSKPRRRNNARVCSRHYDKMFILLASIPPIVGAIYGRDLGTVADYTGLMATAIAFCFPALLYIRSGIMCQRLGIDGDTYYERCGSNVPFAVAIFCFGFVAIFVSLTELMT